MSLNLLLDSGQPMPSPDVQRTTLGLDVLGRYVCNTWDEATAGGTRHFDAVVIGAGMFGGYCAEKIFRFGGANNLKVLVLDAGPFLVPTHLQNLPNLSLYAPDPLLPSNDPGTARNLVWGMPWRSNVEFIGQAYCVAYCASKHALVGVTKAMAIEYGRKGLRVNAVCPGGVNTNILGGFMPPEGSSMNLISRSFLTRDMQEPESVAALVAYVGSDEAYYVNGAVMAIDGGTTTG